MDSKFIWPVTILIACTVLGGFFYVSQMNKQHSIERQQAIQLQIDQQQAAAKQEKEKTDTMFANNLKCQTLLKDLKQRWNNVVGIYYSELRNTCIVKYTTKGVVDEAPIEDMQDTN